MSSITERDLAVLKILSEKLGNEERVEEEAEDTSDVYTWSIEVRDVCQRFLEQEGTHIWRNDGLIALSAMKDLSVKFQEVDRDGNGVGEQKDAEIQVLLAQRSAHHPREFTIRVFVHDLIPGVGGGLLPRSLLLREVKPNLVTPTVYEHNQYLREARFSDMEFWKETAIDTIQASLGK